MMKLVAFFLSIFFSCALWAQIDPDQILFGLEATFQDREIVNEPGRMTMETPHKKAQFDGMIQSFLDVMGAPDAQITPVNSQHFKPGVKITLGNKDEYIVDMEPVCIEWNQRPLKLNEIAKRWQPVYKAAARMNLVPYVNPAAERSGMGHIHIGGKKISENPFFRNPLLLRNVMVYFHQHPSLLWGFAEAFDIGENSNIETYHSQYRQAAFERAVAEFDQWYQQASENERVDGAFRFLSLLATYGGHDFFHHYRYINLEHVAALAGGSMSVDGERTGKYTIEFRNIRPYKSPEHAQAMAELLLSVMKPLAVPDYKVPFRHVSLEEYKRFHSGLVTADDWLKVKAELHLPRNPLWEDMIGEYTQNLSSQRVAALRAKDLTVAPAYSEKNKKGQSFELVLPYSAAEPTVSSPAGIQNFQLVTDTQGKKSWVTVVSATAGVLKPEDILSGSKLRILYKAPVCAKVYPAALAQ